MNNFFKSTTFKVLITVAIVLLSASIMATLTATSTSPLTKVVSVFTSPLQDVASYFSAKFDALTGGFISSKSYQDRVTELEEQVAEYQKQLVDYEKTKKQLATYEEFLDTLSLVKEVRYGSMFTFIYSPRKGTPAAEMEDPITKKEKTKWFLELLKVQEEIAAENGNE